MATTRLLALTSGGGQNGLGTKIAATATPGTFVTQSPNDLSTWTEVWLWAVNRNAASVTLTIEWGDATVDNRIPIVIPPADPPILVVPGWILQNNLGVRAYASAANDISIFGFQRLIEGQWTE